MTDDDADAQLIMRGETAILTDADDLDAAQASGRWVESDVVVNYE